MDPIAADVMAAQNDSTRFAISMRVLAKEQAVEKQQGQAVVDLIAAAGESQKSIRTASGGVDTYA